MQMQVQPGLRLSTIVPIDLHETMRTMWSTFLLFFRFIFDNWLSSFSCKLRLSKDNGEFLCSSPSYQSRLLGADHRAHRNCNSSSRTVVRSIIGTDRDNYIVVVAFVQSSVHDGSRLILKIRKLASSLLADIRTDRISFSPPTAASSIRRKFCQSLIEARKLSRWCFLADWPIFSIISCLNKSNRTWVKWVRDRLGANRSPCRCFRPNSIRIEIKFMPSSLDNTT